MVLDAQGGGLSGFDLADALRRAGIQPEYEDRCFVVLLPSADTPPEDFQRLMEFARRELPGLPKAPEEREENLLSLWPSQKGDDPPAGHPFPQPLSSPFPGGGPGGGRSASPCPPGVPVVMAGEYIDQASAELLLRRRFPAVEVVEEEAEKGREK